MIHFDKEWTVKHRNKIKQEGRTVTAANKGLNCVSHDLSHQSLTCFSV